MHGDLFEIGVWRGRSASVLASYCKDDEILYLCDLQVDEPAVQHGIRGRRGERPQHRADVGAVQRPAGQLDLRAMHQTVRWFHIDGEHTGSAVYRELELANRIVTPTASW